MSLQLWLPLIRDTENQGLITSTITSTNVTANTSGKLGGCYSFNGSSSYLIGTNSPLNNNSTEWSYCCWVKFTTLSKDQCLYSNRTSTASTGITVFYDNGGNILMDDGVRWTVALTTPFVVDTWYHICVTRKAGVKKCLYINGILQSSTTTTGTQSTADSTRFTIGASQNASTTVNANYLNGYLNDIRVYDHELSPKEIEVISRALTVHHPLSDPGNANMLSNSIPTSTSGWAASGTDWSRALVDAEGSLNGKAIRATYEGTAGSVRGGVYHSLTAGTSVFAEGDTYTITARLRASTNCEIRLYNSLGSTTTANITTEWKTYTVSSTVTTPTANGRSYILMQSSYVTTGVWLECCMIKMEKGSKSTPWIPYPTDAAYTALGFDTTVDYDVSGYNYHGEKLGTFAYNSDSPRYSSCTVFNGTDSAINCGNDYHVQGAKNMTVSLWAYLPDWTVETTQPFISCQESGGFIVSRMSGTTIRGRFDRYTASDLSTRAYAQADYVCELTGWHMITATYDTSAIKLYLDGVLVKTSSSTTYGIHFTSNVNTYIGAEATTSKRCIAPFIDGKVSDIRIYYTTLTAAQIAELYNTAVSAANNGTLLGYELVES